MKTYFKHLPFLSNWLTRRRIKQDPIGYARSLGVKIGKDCKIVNLHQRTFGSEPYLVSMGDHVELAAEVRFLPHDGSVWVFRDTHPDWDLFGPISIGNNVFIGYRSIVLPGTKIGNNCVIGAGSVVRGTIPDGSVAAGVPVKVIRRIEDYKVKVAGNVLETKQLNRSQKRKFLLDHYNL